MNEVNPEIFTALDKQFTQILQSISYIIPMEFGIAHKIHQHIARQGMVLKGPGAFSLEQIQSSIKERLHLQFELSEVKDAIEGLIDKGEVSSLEEEKYQLTETTYHEWTEKNYAKEESRIQVINGWTKEISKIHTLSGKEISYLESDLRIYTTKLLQMHGAECTALLYPKEKKTKYFLSRVSKEIFLYLPIKNRNKRVIRIRSLELPRFFENATLKRKAYIAELLDSAFIYHIVHLDHTCSNVIKKQLQGITLYLDTNFLYRLFGFHGLDAENAIRRVLEISNQMDIEVLVAEKTIEEYKNALSFDIQKLKQYTLPLRRLARIGGILSSKDNFITAYWKRYAATGISINDFLNIYSQVESLLHKERIEIDYESGDKIANDPKLKVEIAHLSAFITYHNRVFPGRTISKAIPVVEHDAYLRFLVKKKRGHNPESFTEAKTWLLTCDHSLITYEYYMKESGKEQKSTMNTSIMAHQWLQVLRPLLPRTEDYNVTFADLLCSPYLRTYGSVSSKISAQILARASEVNRFGPQVATQLLTNTYFARKIAIATDEQEEQKILKQTM